MGNLLVEELLGLYLFYANLLLTFYFSFYFFLKTIAKGEPLSPQMVVWIVPIIIFFFPVIGTRSEYYLDYSYNLIIFFGIAGILLATSITKVPILNESSFLSSSLGVKSQYLSLNKYELPSKLIFLGATIYLGYLFYTIGVLIVQHGGVLQAFAVGRLNAYLGGEILRGRTIALFVFLPEICMYIYIGKCLCERKHLKGIFLVLVLTVFYLLTANTRLPMIMPLLAMVLVLIRANSKVLLVYLQPILMLVGLFLIMLFLVVGNFIRTGNIELLFEEETFQLNMIDKQSGQDLGYYSWLGELKDKIDSEELDLDYGKGWFYYGIINFIPRAIWPEKPITSTSNRLTEEVYGVRVGQGEPVTTFTILGDGFWQFHYVGVAIATFIFTFLFIKIIENIAEYRYSDYWTSMILIQMATDFRGEMPIPRFISLLFVLYLMSIVRKKPIFHYSLQQAK